jgi:hypothetical protein
MTSAETTQRLQVHRSDAAPTARRQHSFPAARRRLTLADLTKAERERVDLAFHEAGHAIAGVLLGGQLRCAVVGDGRVFGPTGLTRFDHLPASHDATVAYAGPWAQARWTTGRRPTMRDLYAHMACTRHDSDAAVLRRSGGTSAAAEVVPLLERCWPSVVKLAVQVFRGGEVSHPDVVAALRLSRDPATRAFELANIRAGAAPGTFTVTAPGQELLSGRREVREAVVAMR